MKSRRQRRLAASLGASKLSGKPPRGYRAIGAATSSSPASMGASSRKRMRPASDSLLCFSRSTEAEEAALARALAAPLIDQPAQRLEQLRHALHFVEDHQLVAMLREIQHGVCQFGEIGVSFEIKVDRGPEAARCSASEVLPTWRGTEQGNGLAPRSGPVAGAAGVDDGSSNHAIVESRSGFTRIERPTQLPSGVRPTRRSAYRLSASCPSCCLDCTPFTESTVDDRAEARMRPPSSVGASGVME